MSFQGNLQSLCLFDVVQSITNNQLTGTLELHVGRLERRIHFEDGRIAMVSLGQGVGLPMKQYLLRRGWVTEKALEKALARRGTSRVLLPELLDKQGVLSADQFRAAVEEHVSEVMYDLLLVKEAEYQFQEGPPPKGWFDLVQKSLKLALETPPLMVEGARREDEWARIRKLVGSERDLFLAVGEPGELDEDHALLFEALDGRNDLAAIEPILGRSHFDVCALLCDLVEWGFARPVNPGELKGLAEEAMEAGDLERSAGLLEHALELERVNPELRQKLAGVLEALGRGKEAAQAWAILGLRAMRDGDDAEALDAFRRACELDPDDVGLHERIFEVEERAGATGDYARVAIELSMRYHDLGLLEKAVEVLDRAMKRPDLSGRPELLGRLVDFEKQGGRSEQAHRRVLQAADEAERCGDRDRALALLETGARCFPESREVQGRREDILSFRREKLAAFRRRLLLRAGGLLAAVGLGWLGLQEWRLHGDLRQMLHDAPQAVAEDRALIALEVAQKMAEAHPWALSRGLVEELAAGLAEAEKQSIRRAALAGDFRSERLEALARLRPELELDSWRGWLQEARELEQRFGPWLGHGGDRGGDPFTFDAAMAPRMTELYPRLDAEGQARMRARFAALDCVVALPLFVEHALHGTEEPVLQGQGLGSVVDRLAKKAREGSVSGGRYALLRACRMLEDDLFGPQPTRAESLLPMLLPGLDRPPRNREEFRSYTGS
ncbi:MAG: DUF4388 domain-containing protein [Planctomycetota bacterium]